jgi:hypothetical protein
MFILYTGAMKKLFLFSLALIFCQLPAFSQHCLPEGITFTTQSQIDSFQVNYPECTVIEGDVMIAGDDISNLEGLASLTKINGEIVICFNDSLAILTGLEGLTSIGDALRIYENNSLLSLSGLDNIDPASLGIIEIWHNPLLSDCDVQWICNYLGDPKGTINIYQNAVGCNNPFEIANSCGIVLSCLPYGNYYFLSQADVDNFPSYYSNCKKLEGFVQIHGEDISNLDSLTGIDTINGSLHVCGNNNLSSLNGLNNLKYIRDDLALGYWECGNNPDLTSLSGLNKLTSVGRAMLIMWNDGLIDLEGLDSLISVGYSLQIVENASLKSLEGINKLYSVSELDIGYNDSLLSLDGLQGLIKVNHYFDISGNPMLTGIEGIRNVNVDSLWLLRITANDSLTKCSVQSVCDYLNMPEGSVEIHDNAMGCNSREEVDAACGVGIEEVISRQSSVVSYPNPVSDLVTFDINLQDPSKVSLIISNNLGQFVVTILDESMDKGEHQVIWNANGMKPGIYFYTMQSVSQSFTGKMVVLK